MANYNISSGFSDTADNLKDFSNKTLMHETYYFHGKKHGIEKWYYENGQIKSEQTFQFDIPIDDQIRFYPDGSIIY